NRLSLHASLDCASVLSNSLKIKHGFKFLFFAVENAPLIISDLDKVEAHSVCNSLDYVDKVQAHSVCNSLDYVDKVQAQSKKRRKKESTQLHSVCRHTRSRGLYTATL
ncbi:MAG: hypothetical protein PHS48_07605, partial [Bacteroidales bacterium]|nr:hypothetical protein [Bacteroidales bacterium]